ncbi:MAG: hypothetical protein MRJ92_04960 [Nitrospira sp.]|nr:hypothetical protein [Nitrospira sp.]
MDKLEALRPLSSACCVTGFRKYHKSQRLGHAARNVTKKNGPHSGQPDQFCRRPTEKGTAEGFDRGGEQRKLGRRVTMVAERHDEGFKAAVPMPPVRFSTPIATAITRPTLSTQANHS